MEWLQSIQHSIQFMEDNLTEKISVEDVYKEVFSSSAHFQRMFALVTGVAVGEYIRNRRLSLAGRELLLPENKVIDVALKYQYETPESFTKAFSRFHGFPPSETKKQRDRLKYFYPLTIRISIQGGFAMEQKIIDEFCWNNLLSKSGSEKEKYKMIATWAVNARCKNPDVFDSLTEWILEDAEWTTEKLDENKQILMQGVLAHFKEQNAELRRVLKELEPAGVVNPAVFRKLDEFDAELSGKCTDVKMQDAVTKMFDDFTSMKDRKVREMVAGNKTGSTGTDHVEVFGYINSLKERDAGVQWTLFMPDEVERRQQGFHVVDFVYRKLPAMKFVGFEGEEYADVEKRLAMMKKIDALTEFKSGFDYDLFFMHFNGENVDIGTWHGVFGRFLKPDAPIPEGCISFDFIPEFTDENPGAPYLSQFAMATFEGDKKAMHESEGFDGDAMYDTTRNIILGQGGSIPYPIKYWTAEVFPDGCDKDSTMYLFSACLEE